MSLQQAAATNRLDGQNFVAAICLMNSNWFEFEKNKRKQPGRSIRADEATCRSDVSERFFALCVSALNVLSLLFQTLAL